MRITKCFAGLLAAVLILSILAGCGNSTPGGQEDPAAAEGNMGNVIGYPPKEINGIIQWGAGGGTDSLMRPLSVLRRTS